MLRRSAFLVGVALLLGAVASVSGNVVRVLEFTSDDSTRRRLQALGVLSVDLVHAVLVLGAAIALSLGVELERRSAARERILGIAMAVAFTIGTVPIYSAIDPIGGIDLSTASRSVGPSGPARVASWLNALAVALVAGSAVVVLWRSGRAAEEEDEAFDEPGSTMRDG